MRIVITGISGLLGRKLYEVLSPGNELGGVYLSNEVEGCRHLDISNRSDVEEFFETVNPEAVVHTAALCNADFCEKEKELTWKINVEGTRNIVRVCKRKKIKLVYISSDYVFDGSSGPYKEDSATNPVNYYGLTKLEGERAVKEELYDYLIIRPGILYGYNDNGGKKTYINQVIESLKEKRSYQADGETVKYPTLIDDVSSVIRLLLEKGERGIYHIATQQGTTRYEWAKKIAGVYNLDTKGIRSVSPQGIAPRPPDVRLLIEKLKKVLPDFSPVPVEDGLWLMKRQEGCMFKLIYTLRPDKKSMDESVSIFRIRLGKELADEHPATGEIVVPVPESGVYAATGYAQVSKKPLFFGLVRDYYTKRTLFEPKLRDRNEMLNRRLIAVPDIVRGKSIVLIDEAILSGTTLKLAIARLKECNAGEIHVRIPAPPMLFRCPARMQPENIRLLAGEFGRSPQEKEKIEKTMAESLGVKSLRFLSLKKFIGSASGERCVYCFAKEEGK